MKHGILNIILFDIVLADEKLKNKKADIVEKSLQNDDIAGTNKRTQAK